MTEIRTLLLSASVLGLVSAVQAEDANFSECHSIEGNLSRLACYDEVTGRKTEGVDLKKPADVAPKELVEETTAPAPEEPQGEQWRYSEEVSALDNRKDVWLSVKSVNTERNSIGSPIYATLWVRCMENKTNLLIALDSYTTDNQSVKYKFDDEPVKKQWMETMRGGDGIGIWSGGRAIPFIKGMFGKDEMVVAYRTYSNSVELKFDISGLRARIDPLAVECQWKP